MKPLSTIPKQMKRSGIRVLMELASGVPDVIHLEVGEPDFITPVHIIDSGFNHLLRPAMYDAFHFIWPVKVAPLHVPAQRKRQMELPELQRCDVVGPLCETGDVLAKDWQMPGVERGDLLCIFTAGAYGMAMASNYNAMCRPPASCPHPPPTRVIGRL